MNADLFNVSMNRIEFKLQDIQESIQTQLDKLESIRKEFDDFKEEVLREAFEK